MPRPRKPRFVDAHPTVDGFFPNRQGSIGREEVFLTVEGFEAIRLSDYEGLDQEAAAGRMNVSRQTFGRILLEARKIIADSLVNGKAMRIQGGSFELPCGGRGRRRRRRGGPF